jgi:hypothetical protein
MASMIGPGFDREVTAPVALQRPIRLATAGALVLLALWLAPPLMNRIDGRDIEGTTESIQRYVPPGSQRDQALQVVADYHHQKDVAEWVRDGMVICALVVAFSAGKRK